MKCKDCKYYNADTNRCVNLRKMKETTPESGCSMWKAIKDGRSSRWGK